MNLTEPQAGSDLSAIRSKAEPSEDGSYKISGQKIYITYGEHDMAENIIHLVLARTPDAPEGVKGISLFIVPKFLDDGTRNDVLCTGIEHKLGIHASPTCTMQFGDQGGATGFLVGQENEGLKYMFTMMNNARLSVGLQGVAIAERAYQHALGYAKDREQGTSFTDKSKRVAIIEHADVKRMLLSMKAQIEAFRALTYDAALHIDMATTGDKAAQSHVELLTPIVKACATDMAVEVTSTGVQIHGGMGFVEETGAAQYYRDARILPIYEGTNGIQALDLVFRKILRDQGAGLKSYIAEMNKFCNSLDSDKMSFVSPLTNALEKLTQATDFLLSQDMSKAYDVSAVATPYLKVFGYTAAGYMLARSAHAAQKKIGQGSDEFMMDKMNTTDFYMVHVLPQAVASGEAVINGAKYVVNARF